MWDLGGGMTSSGSVLMMRCQAADWEGSPGMMPRTPSWFSVAPSAEVGLAVCGVETVTGEAIFREDGADVAVETDLGLRLGGVEGCSSEGG